VRVAIVLGTSAGGIGAHVRMLAAGLAAAGASITVLGPASAAERFGLGELAGVPFRTAEFGSRPAPRDVGAVLRLRRALGGAATFNPRTLDRAGTVRPDVVHAHGMRAGALCALALATIPAGKRPPLVVTVHNAPPAGGGARALVYRALERVVARRAALVLCVSRDLDERMTAAGARHVGRAVVPAPGSASGSASGNAAPDAGFRRPAGLPAGRPVVLGAGRLAAQKGFDVLLEAATSWRDFDPVPQVVIAGEGPLLARLRGRAQELGVDALFLGHRDDVPALLAVCDVFVLPSHWEGQPLVLQEALRAGAAIVASRAGGIPELAGPDAACLVRPGDAAQLAASVREVLLDQSRATRLRSAARHRAAGLPAEADAIAAVLACYRRAGAP
jgi:glycosyltransferase involved in cell wall biosynthesis